MEQEISQQITEEQALTELKRGYKKSEKILNDQSKLDKFLKQMEAKLMKSIPCLPMQQLQARTYSP